jgi:hypothetical protein
MNGSVIFESQPSTLFGASDQPVLKATLNNLTDRRRAIEVHSSRVVGKQEVIRFLPVCPDVSTRMSSPSQRDIGRPFP